MKKDDILKYTGDFEENLRRRLKDPELAQAYLESALESYEEDGDTDSLLLAIRDVAQAQGRARNLTIQLDNLLETLFGLGFRVRLERYNIPAH